MPRIYSCFLLYILKSRKMKKRMIVTCSVISVHHATATRHIPSLIVFYYIAQCFHGLSSFHIISVGYIWNIIHNNAFVKINYDGLLLLSIAKQSLSNSSYLISHCSLFITHYSGNFMANYHPASFLFFISHLASFLWHPCGHGICRLYNICRP